MSRQAVFRSGLGLVAITAIVAGVGVLAPFGEAPPRQAPPSGAPAEAVVDSARFDAEVATKAMDRLRLFRTGNAGEELELDADEITAVLRHAIPGVVPAGVSEPRVSLEDGGVRITARVAAAAFPGTPMLAPLLGVLPDTLDVDVRGTVVRDVGGLAFRIDRVTAEHVPLPDGVVASVVASLAESGAATVVGPGRDEWPTLRLAWPSGISSLYVSGDRLVLERAGMAEAIIDGSD